MMQVETASEQVVSRDQALEWLRMMMLIRRFEERAEMMYQKGNKIGGFFHQYSGQEPVAVGSIGALRDNDYVITAYRDHGHALARGMTPKAAMAELLGQVDRLLERQGRLDALLRRRKELFGRPRHRRQPRRRWPPASPSPSSISGEDRVCICYLGDGAMNQGSVHEAFNMAALWKLPVIYVVENNNYAMGTSLKRSSAVLDLTVRGAKAYGIPGADDQRQRHRADGQDRQGSRQPRQERRRAHLHRRPDLPLQGPLDQRPGQVPPQGRARLGRRPGSDRRLSESRS